MAESQRSSPEESGKYPKTPVPASKEPFARQFEHDTRTPINTAKLGVQLLELNLPDDPKVREPLDHIKRSMNDLSAMLKEAVNKEPLPEVSLDYVHTMIKYTLENICAHDPNLAGKCVVCCEEKTDSNDEISNDCETMRIILSALPEEVKRYNVRFSSNAARRIFDNLLRNSLRKGAKKILVKIEKQNQYDVSLSVSDDGEGMKLDILDKIRHGEESSDKSTGEMIQGGTIADHGHGLSAVRQIIVDRCEGSMNVYSVKKDDLEDSGGFNLQDQESQTIHPFPHGVTVRFSFHVHSMRVNGDTINPAIAQTPLITRRNFGRVLGATTAAAALGWTSWLAMRPDDRVESPVDNEPVSPLSKIILDPKTNALQSFEYGFGDVRIAYEAGKEMPPDTIRVIPLAFDGLSATAVVPAPVNGRQQRSTYIFGTPDGIFSYVDTRLNGMRRMAFMDLPPGASDGKPALLDDTVIHPAMEKTKMEAKYDATSMEILHSASFKAKAESLKKIAEQIGVSENRDYAPFNYVHPVLSNLLGMLRSFEGHAVSAYDKEELERLVQAAEKFIIAEPSLIRELRYEAYELRKDILLDHRNSLCLRNVDPVQAKKMVQVF